MAYRSFSSSTRYMYVHTNHSDCVLMNVKHGGDGAGVHGGGGGGGTC